MPDKSRTTEQAATKSGIMPRPSFEPEVRREAPPPVTLPEVRDEGATTGIIYFDPEGEDGSAERDNDQGKV